MMPVEHKVETRFNSTTLKIGNVEQAKSQKLMKIPSTFNGRNIYLWKII